MKTIKFELETITPMFLSGADGKNAELRPPSIKGLMRFWWRAVRGLEDIEQLREEESEIFGGGGDKAKKSSFSIKIPYNNIEPNRTKFPDNPEHKVEVKIKGNIRKINILEYLAYGTLEWDRRRKQNIFIRDYFDVNKNLDVVVLFRNEEIIDDVLKSFYFLSAFGGLGSRSRNGFGNFNVLNRESFIEIGKEYVDNIVPTKEMLKLFIKSNSVPSYSAFSNGMRLFKTKNKFDTWDKALAEIGIIYKECREKLEPHHKYDKRQYIGAPLDPPKESFKSILDRHSKPYFIRIIKEKNKFNAYILYLLSKYCEGLEEDRNKRKINHANENKQFESVCNDFNKLLASKLEEVIL